MNIHANAKPAFRQPLFGAVRTDLIKTGPDLKPEYESLAKQFGEAMVTLEKQQGFQHATILKQADEAGLDIVLKAESKKQWDLPPKNGPEPSPADDVVLMASVYPKGSDRPISGQKHIGSGMRLKRALPQGTPLEMAKKVLEDTYPCIIEAMGHLLKQAKLKQ